ncbi:caveolin-3-like [Physella acuta]|uniref:caveolin-3-like n=1 Tax=Physella acuta TaxID=109671 RepID=UPI0027DE305E|nr:caveolin-3-like [Physella acuta]
MNPGEATVQVNLGQSRDEPGEKAPADEASRDPEMVNAHVKVAFEEIFAEPHQTVYSFDSVWALSICVFNGTKLWSYRVLTLVCAVPLAVFWGLHFGLLSCCTIWCCRPLTKACEINFSCLKAFLQIILDSMWRPSFEAFGYILHNIRVRLIKGE